MRSLHKVVLLLILCCLTLTSCWDQRVFDQVGLILTAGIDQSENDKLLVTFVYPIVGNVKETTVGIEINESSLLRGAREESRLSSPKYIQGGKTQQILVSESLAKTGIHDLLEIFQRDVALPAITYVVVVEGSASELLLKSSEFKDMPSISFYLFQLLDYNAKTANIPNTKVFDFDINFFAPGLDPVTPMIKLEKDTIKISGCALFSEDKMVGKLDHDQTMMLMGLMGQLKYTDFMVSDSKLPSDTPNKNGIAVTLRKPKRKINIDFDEEGKPVIDISMKYDCVLDEYKWNKTNDPVEQKKLEELLTNKLESVLNETIRKIQELKSDPIGFGDMIRAKYYDYWQSIEWKEIYPEAQIKVSVDLEIVIEGLIK